MKKISTISMQSLKNIQNSYFCFIVSAIPKKINIENFTLELFVNNYEAIFNRLKLWTG